MHDLQYRGHRPRLLHCKNIWVISTCFCLPELLTSIDDYTTISGLKQLKTFLQCINRVETDIEMFNQLVS